MFKNKYLNILIIIFCIVLVIAAGYFAYTQFFKTSDGVAYKQSTSSENNEPDNKPATNSGLTVDDSMQNSAQMSSGQQQNSTKTTNGSTSSFKEYEQYVESTTIYFGDIKEGTGTEASAQKTVKVTYIGYLTTGQIFDQSRVDNTGALQPLEFTLGSGQLIPGFEQGVNGMKVGGERRIIIPPSLGYGNQAQGSIPANSVLVFDVKLVSVD
jgi:FKBP-type peptidyl-prolyl cis-trans isomerase